MKHLILANFFCQNERKWVTHGNCDAIRRKINYNIDSNFTSGKRSCPSMSKDDEVVLADMIKWEAVVTGNAKKHCIQNLGNQT